MSAPWQDWQVVAIGYVQLVIGIAIGWQWRRWKLLDEWWAELRSQQQWLRQQGAELAEIARAAGIPLRRDHSRPGDER